MQEVHPQSRQKNQQIALISRQRQSLGQSSGGYQETFLETEPRSRVDRKEPFTDTEPRTKDCDREAVLEPGKGRQRSCSQTKGLKQGNSQTEYGELLTP